MRPALSSLVAVLALAHAGDARAQSPAEELRARELFEEGTALANTGKCPEALDKFRESLLFKESKGGFLGLGLCLEEGGELVDALVAYKRLRDLALREGNDKFRERAEQKSEELSKRIPRVTIVVPEDARVEGLIIAVDGSALHEKLVGVSVPVDPGPHQITASAEGYQTWSTLFQASEKQSLEVEIASLEKTLPLEAAAAPSPASPAELPTPTIDLSRDSSLPAPARKVARFGVGIGGSYLAAGDIDTGLEPTLDLSLAWLPTDRIDLGASFNYSQEDWEAEMVAGTNSFLSFLVTAGYSLPTPVADLKVRAELGLGSQIVLGLDDSSLNPLVDSDYEATGPIVLALGRVGLGLAYAVSPSVSLTFVPLQLSSSPRREGLERSIERLSSLQSLLGASATF